MGENPKSHRDRIIHRWAAERDKTQTEIAFWREPSWHYVSRIAIRTGKMSRRNMSLA